MAEEKKIICNDCGIGIMFLYNEDDMFKTIKCSHCGALAVGLKDKNVKNHEV